MNELEFSFVIRHFACRGNFFNKWFFCDISNDCAGGNVQRTSKKLKIIAVCKVKQISSFVRGKPNLTKKVEDIQSILMKSAMILRAKPDKKIESRHSNADKNTNCVN